MGFDQQHQICILSSERTVFVDASRVDELLKAVVERFPALAEPLALMSIAVDGEIHLNPDYLPLTEKSEVHLVPRIAGG